MNNLQWFWLGWIFSIITLKILEYLFKKYSMDKKQVDDGPSPSLPLLEGEDD